MFVKVCKKDQSDNVIDLSQNLKKMFPSPTEKDDDADAEAEAEAEKEKPPKKKVRVCWSCQKNAETDGVTLLKCGACRRARYCDVECQSEDWEYHREYCQAIQERRAQRDGMKETKVKEENVVKAEDIEGYRGNTEDLDSLLQFIDGEENKKKSKKARDKVVQKNPYNGKSLEMEEISNNSDQETGKIRPAR